MDLIMEQFPIVFNALNVGFLQTLKLFFVTLLGAIPLGLVISFGSMSRFRPLSYITIADYILFSRDRSGK